ncbi:hypothetical protein [Paenibacillus chitinolyticus]
MKTTFHPEVNPAQNKSCRPFRYSRQRLQLFTSPITITPAERKLAFYLHDFAQRISLVRSISKSAHIRQSFPPKTYPL